ncbi:MAG: hypothetical protein H7061_08425 [Bdellovibrionaceae bacterium]|nr:hypothetical protein [Bdellovibrio sp.]
MQKKENSFTPILFNIIIPVLILNKGHKWGLDPRVAVVIALSFPLFITLKSWFFSKKLNFISLLGLLNVVVSGTLTLLALGGTWFAVKEAAFPLLIGVFVFGSSYSRKPFFQTLFMNPTTFDVDKVTQKLETEEKKESFLKLMRLTTRWLSISFLMSAFLNFVLAIRIFTPFDDGLADSQKREIINEQLSRMTLYSLGVILVPSMIFLGALLYYTFKKINALTGLSADELLIKS